MTILKNAVYVTLLKSIHLKNRVCSCLCREEAVEAGGPEGDGGHLLGYEQLHHAALLEAGARGLLPHPVQCTALRTQRHRSYPQPGPHSPSAGEQVCSVSKPDIKYATRSRIIACVSIKCY